MKISFKWLNEYIDLQDFKTNIDEISSRLTQAGLEVEGIEDPSKHWDKVVVGHIVKFDKHPDADRLTLCQVDIGESEPSQIICGATNHKLGDYVVVATPGAVLPGNFKIKKSKIRGVASNGMLCSETELGLGEESDGIVILEGEPKTGENFRSIYPHADIVFDLNVTPNRADCLSHLGLARELAALLDRPVKTPEAVLQESGAEVSSVIDVQLVDDEGCPRYCGRILKGIKVQPSPAWLAQRLKAVGIKAINNVVDVTNYVMFEYGQPLHAFDLQELKGQKIVVEKAKDKEKFVTLDGTELSLSSSDLLIRDGERAVALAGVVGGKNSGVSDTTTDIFLESAFFRAEGVRKTSRGHGIETDACYRFSRGVDPSQTLNAMNRAAFLIQQVAGGEVQKGLVDLYPKPVRFAPIATTSNFIGQRLGYEVTDGDFETWMNRLNCQVEKSGDGFSVTPPPYRWDLNRQEDLVEEYGRLQGYDKILEKLPALVEEPTNHGKVFLNEKRVKSLLSGLGCYEAVNYAFIAKEAASEVWGSQGSPKNFGLSWSSESVHLTNPLSEELMAMRESLLPGLLKNMTHNDHHGVHYGRLFEIGQGHFVDDGPQEQGRLALAFWGEPDGLWKAKGGEDNFCLYSLKTAVESLLTKLGGKSWQWKKVSTEDCPPGFHPGQSVSLVYEGKPIGILGGIHPQLQSQAKIRSKVAWAELNFEKLMSRQPKISKFKPVPKFPMVERDISLMAPESLTAEEIGGQIKKSAGPLLENYRVFDIYQDKDLKAAGRKSIAFRLRFQSDKETLSDGVINPLRDQIVAHLCKKLPVESR